MASDPAPRPGTEAPMSDAELGERIARAALLKGTFTLRSGRTSSYYLDKYRFETDPAILRALGERLAARVDERIDRLAGAELGGIPLVTAAAMASYRPCLFIRNRKKDYGTANQLEGLLEAGDRVLLVEDVATSGGQVIEAAGTLEEAGAKVAGILAVIDREEGARENIEAAGYPFEALFTRTSLGLETA